MEMGFPGLHPPLISGPDQMCLLVQSLNSLRLLAAGLTNGHIWQMHRATPKGRNCSLKKTLWAELSLWSQQKGQGSESGLLHFWVALLTGWSVRMLPSAPSQSSACLVI